MGCDGCDVSQLDRMSRSLLSDSRFLLCAYQFPTDSIVGTYCLLAPNVVNNGDCQCQCQARRGSPIQVVKLSDQAKKVLYLVPIAVPNPQVQRQGSGVVSSDW
eukprot:3577286-Rhodomonas_salina.2